MHSFVQQIWVEVYLSRICPCLVGLMLGKIAQLNAHYLHAMIRNAGHAADSGLHPMCPGLINQKPINLAANFGCCVQSRTS